MKFIRLTNIIINQAHIRYVHIHPERYVINFNSTEFSGSLLFGSGVSSGDLKMEISKKDHKDDYDAFTEWMKKTD